MIFDTLFMYKISISHASDPACCVKQRNNNHVNDTLYFISLSTNNHARCHYIVLHNLIIRIEHTYTQSSYCNTEHMVKTK